MRFMESGISMCFSQDYGGTAAPVGHGGAEESRRNNGSAINAAGGNTTFVGFTSPSKQQDIGSVSFGKYIEEAIFTIRLKWIAP